MTDNNKILKEMDDNTPSNVKNMAVFDNTHIENFIMGGIDEFDEKIYEHSEFTKNGSFSDFNIVNEIKRSCSQINQNSISIIKCAHEGIIKSLYNSIGNNYIDEGYQVYQVIFEESSYSKNPFNQLIEDIKNKNFPYQNKLLLFVFEDSLSSIDETPTLVEKLHTTFIHANTQRNKLNKINCKIVYFTHFEKSITIPYPVIHIPFLKPYLTYYHKVEILEQIQTLQNTGRITSSELELLQGLNSIVHLDDFEQHLEEINYQPFNYKELLRKDEIYKEILFVATFFRQLNFDQFRNLLSNVIKISCQDEEVERRINQWSNCGDNFIHDCKLEYKSLNNNQIIDFIYDQDAERCKQVLLENKRIFLTKIVKKMVSPHFFLSYYSPRKTMGKMNQFVMQTQDYFGVTFLNGLLNSFLNEVEKRRNDVVSLHSNNYENKEDQKRSKQEYQKGLYRFSNLLLHLDANSKTNIVLNFMDSVFQKKGYFCLVDIIGIIRNRSDLTVFNWYKSLLQISNKRIGFLTQNQLINILKNENSHSSEIIQTISQWLPNKHKPYKSYNQLEKQAICIIYFFFESHLRLVEEKKNKVTLNILNRDFNEIKVHIYTIIFIVLNPNLNQIIEEFSPLSESRIIDRVRILELWNTILLEINNKNLTAYFITSIEENLLEKHLRKEFKNALRDIGRDYHQLLLNCKTRSQKEQVKNSKKQLTQFSKNLLL
jgi:hypothetical protein